MKVREEAEVGLSSSLYLLVFLKPDAICLCDLILWID